MKTYSITLNNILQYINVCKHTQESSGSIYPNVTRHYIIYTFLVFLFKL
jgi:hypothetical protein